MRILVIEDDKTVAGYISKGLQEQGHTADCCHDGKQGLLQATTEEYDVLVVDRMLPNLDGLSIVKTLRGSGNLVPALILSALGEIDDRVQGLRAGGDDYLSKPFSFEELLARIEALARRSSAAGQAEETRFSVADLEIDLLSQKVTRDGKKIDLQAREFRLLKFLLQHKNQIVTRTMLLEHVWDYHFDPQTNVIDVHISRLRGKIDREGEPSLIRTVRGTGYIIEDIS